VKVATHGFAICLRFITLRAVQHDSHWTDEPANMKKFDFYEFTGVLAPGAVVVYGLARIYPELGLLVREEKISFGEFGLLLVLAYVAGHLLQSFGNLIEWAWWRCAGGWPSDWVRTRKRDILATAQWQVLPARVREVLDIKCPDDLAAISVADWKAITRQVYAAVRKAGRAERIDIFNGNYGMFRGVAASLIVILVAAFNEVERDRWKLYGVLIVLALLALMRMHRFGVYYARELFVQFIGMKSGESDSPKKEGAE